MMDQLQRSALEHELVHANKNDTTAKAALLVSDTLELVAMELMALRKALEERFPTPKQPKKPTRKR